MTRARDLADIIGPNGDLVVTGDLQVTGTTTTVNSTTVEIADNNILLGSGATTNAQNTGAGLSVLLPDASPDEFATLVYTTSSDSWSFNKNVGIGTTAPGESLHLRAAAPAIRFEDTDVTGVNQIYSNGAEFVISADQSDLDASSKITFLVDGNSKASIYDSGTLAIGAGASSNYLLTTNYDANATFSNAVSDFTQMWQNSGTNMLGVAGADDLTVRLATNNGYSLAFSNAGTEAFRITTGGNIEAPSGTSGNFEIGIEDNATDFFRTSAKGLIIKGNDAFTGGSPQQASAGGDVEVRAGYGVDNTGVGAFAGDLTLSGGIPFSGNNSGAGQIFLKTNNTEVLTVSRDQKVGIGTTNPQHNLDVEISANVIDGIRTGDSTNSQITLGSFDANITNGLGTGGILTGSLFGGIISGGNNGKIVLALRDNDISDSVDIVSGGGNYMTDSTYDTLVASFKADGNVGIGTATPATPLTLKHSTTTDQTGGFRIVDSNDTTRANFYYGGSQSFIIHGASGPVGIDAPALQFATGGATPAVRMTILEEGNVGIGTTNPTENLHLYSSTSNADFLIESTTAGQDSRLYIRRNGSTSRAYLNFSDSAAATANWYTGLLRNASTAFSIGRSDDFGAGFSYLTIDVDGDVGIGTTAPGTKLHVDGAITHKELTSSFSGGGGANRNYFKIFSKNFFNGSSFATNNYRVSVTLGGETGGKIGFAEFDVGFKQQGTGDFFEIVPFRSAYCDVGYTWDVNGGSDSSGLLEIYINADNLYMYFDVQVQARAAPSSSLEGWEFTDTGSGTPPTGMISMTFNQESKGIHYTQTSAPVIEPIQLGAPFDSTTFQVANGTEQATTPDSSTFPVTTTAASITFDSDTYNQGSYRTEFAKIDRSGNLPLYVRNSLGGTTQTNIARFGTHTYSPHVFEVFGDTKIQGDFVADGPVRYFNYLSSARGYLEAEGSYSLLGNDSSGNADIEITIVFKNTTTIYDTAMVTLDLTHAGNTDPMEAASYFIKLRQRSSAVAVLGGPTKVFGDDRPISTAINGLTLTITVSSEGASTATQAAKVKVLGGYYGIDSLSITTA